MAPPNKDKWARRFVISETSRHKKGFTIYKVTSVVRIILYPTFDAIKTSVLLSAGVSEGIAGRRVEGLDLEAIQRLQKALRATASPALDSADKGALAALPQAQILWQI